MKYFILPSSCPVEYISCGQLYKRDQFLHQRRNIRSFVLIYVAKGTFYIAQEGQKYEVSKNQFILLPAGTEHYGYRKSGGELNYFWVHFYPPANMIVRNHLKNLEQQDFCVIPEYGRMEDIGKIPQLFNELLDLAKAVHRCSASLLNHLLSVLLLELSGEYFADQRNSDEYPKHIYQICEWIDHHYQETLSVAEIAEQFHYNPNYLSGEFKRRVGQSLTRYINKVRIENAKNLLVTDDMTIRELADYCGFSDEKYFFRVFKELTGMSPLTYKKTFYKRHHVNR